MRCLIVLVGLLPLLLRAEVPEWSQVPEILARITPPKFPARDFVITNFGAVADGKTDSSKAIFSAIDACAAAGGGRVVIPAGEFLTGAIHLKSNVELQLAANSVLKFSTNVNAYLPAVFTRFEGTECYNFSPFIYALGQTNVAVTGEGTLDGQADESNWLAWVRKQTRAERWMKWVLLQVRLEKKHTPARVKLAKLAADNVPVERRRFGVGDQLRPDFIEFIRCQNVLIEGVKIRRSPMWELHPLLCTNVTVRGVDIVSHGGNNDGCDPESCRDVLIEKCLFDTGDDCIAIKSGRNNDGRRVGVPSVNLVIRDCTMRDGHGGVTIGSEISGGCSNVFVENCTMSSTNLNCVLRLKSNAVRGGVLQNIFMRNVTVGRVNDSVLQIDFLYEEGAKGGFKPVARNVVMENVAVAQTPRVLNVRGFPGAEISGVRIYNSTFKLAQKRDNVIARIYNWIFKPARKPDNAMDADVKLVDCQVEPAK
jgi:unsaturated rhamnogalacturonyl hydrolase